MQAGTGRPPRRCRGLSAVSPPPAERAGRARAPASRSQDPGLLTGMELWCRTVSEPAESVWLVLCSLPGGWISPSCPPGGACPPSQASPDVLCWRLSDLQDTSSSMSRGFSTGPLLEATLHGCLFPAGGDSGSHTFLVVPLPQGPVQDQVVNRVGGRDVCVPVPGTWTRVRLCGGRNSADVIILKTLRWGDDLCVCGPP